MKRLSQFLIFAGTLPLLVSGCSSVSSMMPASGPSRSQIVAENENPKSDIRVISIDEVTLRRLQEARKRADFSSQFPEMVGSAYLVGPGDVLSINIWEAPPATLFTSGDTALMAASSASARMVTLPNQMVSAAGTIDVPFAGRIEVAKLSPQAIQHIIESRLSKLAHDPQVLVQVTGNATSTVTVVGDVGQSLRMPLTAKGEHLLDALAAAGGVRQSVEKETIQLSRKGQVVSMPLERVITDPAQNVPLMPGDVVTVQSLPLKMSILGAVSTNQELNFESQGISLAQALARAGGLQDQRADVRGVFVFRFEDPAVLNNNASGKPMASGEKKIPVVFDLNMQNPASLLLAQNFMMQNKDIVYVSNAPAAELQKFLSLLTSSIYSITSLKTIGN